MGRIHGHLSNAEVNRLLKAVDLAAAKRSGKPADIIHEVARELAPVLDELSVTRSEHAELVAGIIERLSTSGGSYASQAHFGKMSSQFELGSGTSADRPLWSSPSAGRPSLEAEALSGIYSGLNSLYFHDGVIRGFHRIELRERPEAHQTEPTFPGHVFDGTKRFFVVGVQQNHQPRELGSVDPQPLLKNLGNPRRWSAEQREAFRQAIDAQVRAVINTVAPDKNARPQPLDAD